MCMEDVRIGRESFSRQSDLVVGNTSRSLVSASPGRIALLICPPSAGSITVSLDQTAVLGNGITLASTSSPVRLNIQHDGALLTRPMWVIADAGNRRLSIIETFLDRE